MFYFLIIYFVDLLKTTLDLMIYFVELLNFPYEHIISQANHYQTFSYLLPRLFEQGTMPCLNFDGPPSPGHDHLTLNQLPMISNCQCNVSQE